MLVLFFPTRHLERSERSLLPEILRYAQNDGYIMKQPCVYIMTNTSNKVLYIGVTAYPRERAYQHRHGLVKGFTHKYNCTKLVCREVYKTIEDAIGREKQLKGWLRKKKVALIEAQNPLWNDLYEIINA